MPNFIDNSFDQLRRGYEQMYGPILRGRPAPAHIVRTGGPTPIANNPAMGQPYGAGRQPNQPVSDPSQLGPTNLITPDIYKMIAPYINAGTTGADATGAASGTVPGGVQSMINQNYPSGGSYGPVPGLSSVGPDVGTGGTGTYTPVTFDNAMGAPLGSDAELGQPAGNQVLTGPNVSLSPTPIAPAPAVPVQQPQQGQNPPYIWSPQVGGFVPNPNYVATPPINVPLRGPNLDMTTNPEVGQGLGAIAGLLGGGGGGGGSTGGGLSSIAGGASGYGSQFAKNQPNFTIDPSKLAGPLPTPAYFIAPTLSPNTGGVAPWQA